MDIEREDQSTELYKKNSNAAGKKRRKRRGRHRNLGNWFTRLSVGKKVAVVLLGTLICFTVLGIIYISSKMTKLNSKEIPKEDIVMNDLAEGVGEGFTNFALLGLDSRYGEMEKGVRTDTIIVANLNNKTREVKLVSVYRDTLLDLSDGNYQKCNGAFSVGGPKQAIDMLNMNLDLEIEDYVTVDFTIVSDIIDLLGGVEIEVSDVEIPYVNGFMEETARVAGKKAVKITEPGLQLLDGVQATTYARIRSTKGGDFRRAERQRYVIEKMVEKVLRSDLATINKIIDAVLPKVKTSMSATDIFSYAKSFNKYRLGDSMGFPRYKTTDTIPGKGSVVIPTTLESNVIDLHEFLYGDEEYVPSAKVSSISKKIVKMTGKKTGVVGEDWQRPSDMKQNSGSTTDEASDNSIQKIEFTE